MSEPEVLWHTFALCLGMTELIFFLCVFLSPESLSERRYVSTNLFDEVYFRAGMTVLVLLQLLVCALYLARYRLRSQAEAFVAELFVLTAGLGWVITIACDPKTDLVSHSLGAGLFVTGTGAYFVMLLRLTVKNDPKWEQGYDLAAGFVLLCAGVFTVTYIVLYFSSPWSAWLWENLAFLTMVCGYLVFFWSHPFDPAAVLGPRQGSQERLELPRQCVPLLSTVVG